MSALFQPGARFRRMNLFSRFSPRIPLEDLRQGAYLSWGIPDLGSPTRRSSSPPTMRIAFDPQLRLGSTPIAEVRLNHHCRDEIIPILRSLQHIYTQPELRDQLLDAVAHDVNAM